MNMLTAKTHFKKTCGEEIYSREALIQHAILERQYRMKLDPVPWYLQLLLNESFMQKSFHVSISSLSHSHVFFPKQHYLGVLGCVPVNIILLSHYSTGADNPLILDTEQLQ